MPVRPDQVPLDTAKRWSKRLAKASQTIDPQRPLALSQCQLAVAHMLGYPHWHALHTALSSQSAPTAPVAPPSLAWKAPIPTNPEQWYAFWHKALTLEGSTDVHIEMRKDQAQVLVRSFGRLFTFASLDRPRATEGVALILPKRSSDSFLAHDGKFLGYVLDNVVIPGNTQVGRDTLEGRYQSLPVYPGGLDIVLSVKKERNITLSAMGLPGEVEAALLDIASRAGLFVCIGTAGTGRSTLVAALLQELGRRQENARQYAVSEIPDKTLVAPHTTFIPVQHGDADGRNITSPQEAMRADPDTFVIGELRDRQTGHAAWKAARSGARVLSTTHSSGRLLKRLEDFDNQPWAEVVTGWAYCNLFGVLCQACSTRHSNGTRSVNQQGCDACRGRGYTGRQLVLDLWEVDNGVAHKRHSMMDQAADLVRRGLVDDEDVENRTGVRTQGRH